MKRATLDFESEGIDDRPNYPPKPVGLGHHLPGKPYEYDAWGHDSENGVFVLRGKKLVKIEGDPKRRAGLALKDAAKCDSILGWNIAKFDADVSETHMGVRLPPEKIDDGLWTRFLADPHAPDLRLKSSAERVLGDPPDEQQAVFQWLHDHQYIQKKSGKFQKDAGRHIARAPGVLVALYGIGDLTRPERLFEHDMKIVRKEGMYDAYLRERQVSPILLANERQGIRADAERLARDVPIYQKALAKVEAWLRKKLGPVENFASPVDVILALKRRGVVKVFPRTPPSKKFPEGQESKSKSRLTKEFFSDPDVYRALVYRDLVAYILNQNMLPWLEAEWIWTTWQQVRSDSEEGGGARSGRITCSKLGNIVKDPTGGKNPDYLKADDDRIRKLIGLPELPLSRRYVLPDAGGLFVHRDANQEEIRVTAHYEDGALAKAYIEKPDVDIHQFATDTINNASKQGYVRDVIKHVNLRMFYGGGRDGLITHPMLRLDKKMGCKLDCQHTEVRCAAWRAAGEIVSNWKAGLPDVVSLMNRTKGMYERGEPIRTLGGRVYHCKPAGYNKKQDRWTNYSYTALNYLVQPSAADLLRMWMIAYHNHPKRRGRMLCVVHDEINVSAPKKLAKQEGEVLREVMEQTYKLDVPWKSDGDVRPNWGEKAK